MNDFEEYFKAGEPGRRERAEAWATAIGLQQVDGLVPSQFLFNTAIEHIEGRITQNQARRRIRDYYAAQGETTERDPDKEEADASPRTRRGDASATITPRKAKRRSATPTRRRPTRFRSGSLLSSTTVVSSSRPNTISPSMPSSSRAYWHRRGSSAPSTSASANGC